jgi:hypothetical protein
MCVCVVCAAPSLFSFSVFFGEGVSQYPVPEWLLFLNSCREWFFAACSFFVYKGLHLLQTVMLRFVCLHMISYLIQAQACTHAHERVSVRTHPRAPKSHTHNLTS